MRDQLLAQIALALDVERIGDEVWHELVDSIDELDDEPAVQQMLRSSVREHVATVLHIFEHGPPRDRIRLPNAAVENARRLAQREISVMVLLREYRLGQARVLTECLAELAGAPRIRSWSPRWHSGWWT